MDLLGYEAIVHGGNHVSFTEQIWGASKRNKTRIVLALDLENPDRTQLAEQSKKLLQTVKDYVCAVKINRQLVLSLGIRDGVDSLVALAHEFSLPAIMDAKLNDVGHTNEFMARMYIEAGFDALIASPTAGWEGGLDSVFTLARSHGRSVIVLAYMSNPGAEAFYSLNVERDHRARRIFELFTEMAVQWGAHGVIVGATRPDIISRVRQVAGSQLVIYSPGVGAQGGDAKKALLAGSDFLIVGRSICCADDPARASREFRELTA